MFTIAATTSRLRVRMLVLFAVITVGAAIEVSAHRVIGIGHPTVNIAAVRSPTASPVDAPVPIYNTGLSVICFRVTNSSTADNRITGVGLELPGELSGFALVSPLDRGLSLHENVDVPGFPDATMDFAVVAGTNFTGGRPKLGIPPGDPPLMICVSGPFDTAVPIETMLNGVFVGFRGQEPHTSGFDIGVWERRP